MTSVMTPVLAFDIETIPDISGLRRLQDAAAQLSDDQIAEAAFTSRRERTGSDFLPHHLQKVAVISCVFRDHDGFRVKSIGRPEDSEASVIHSFFKIIEKYKPQLVSWNGSGFDLPVLHYRALINAVSAHKYWDLGEDDRDFRYNNYLGRYHTRHIDLMDLLAKYSGRANAPLNEIAQLCGFPGKLGMDGSQVWPAWQAGKNNEVRRYCETDAVNTYLVFCRFQLMRGLLNSESFATEMKLVRETLAAIDEPHWPEFLAGWQEI